MASRRAFITLTGCLVVAGAGAAAGFALLPGESAGGHGPPTIRYGSDVCAQCGMVVSDARFASAWRAAGKPLRFDDIGCMVTAAARELEPTTAFWVHDYRDESWLDAATAAFVVARTIKTPMSYGVAAFATPEAARAAVPSAGEPLTWEGFRQSMARGS